MSVLEKINRKIRSTFKDTRLIKSFDTGGAILIKSFDTGGAIIDYHPIDNYKALSAGNGKLKQWDLLTGEVIDIYNLKSTLPTDSVSYSPDGKTALVSGGGFMQCFDLKTGEETRKQVFENHEVGKSISFSSDGKFVVTGGGSRKGILWDAKTWRVIHELSHSDIDFTDQVEHVAFSPDGKTILTNDDYGSLKLWDVDTGNELNRFVVLRHYGTDFSYSPDSKSILVCGHNINRLNLHNGKIIKKFTKQNHGARCVKFSPNGKTALSTCYADEVMTLWNVSTGKIIRSFYGHTNGINSIAFSPDGAMALSGSYDRTMKLWSL